MPNKSNYLEVNRELWNRRTDIHLQSEFYNGDNFIKGKNSLNEIELKLLSDISGKSILHLQCHFGQDTLSMARLGANTTGIDFSDTAIRAANELTKQLRLNSEFICCDIYDLPNHLDKKFDIVFTSYGTIGWLPDLDRWGQIISRFLKPGGQFIFAEFHPVVWMFDNDFSKIQYSYFNIEAIEETQSGTYADRNAAIKQEEITWNHSLDEVFAALLLNGLEVTDFKEYDYSPYKCFLQAEEYEKGKFRIKHLAGKIPMVYSIVAIKKLRSS